MKFEKLEKKEEGKFITRYDLTYRLENGEEKVYEIISREKDLTGLQDLQKDQPDSVVLIMEDESGERLLLAREFRMAIGAWVYNFPAGLIDPGETVEEAAARELREETGLETAFIEQFGCFTEVNRDPRERVITIAFYALVRKAEVQGGDDAAAARWFPIGDVPPLAFDHDRILRVALGKLREKIHFEPVGFELLPEVFTMPQLQSLYEAILEVRFDRRNFAGKMLKLGILEQAEERPAGTGSRIPVRYRFNADRYKEMKSKGFKLEF